MDNERAVTDDLIPGQLDITGKEVKIDNATPDAMQMYSKSNRKKKTFEVDEDLIQLIRIEAAIKDISINDYINSVLWKSISTSTKKILKK